MPLEKKGIHWYLTDEEVRFTRDQLDSLRARGVYEPGKWFVSGFNRKPEALGLTLPDHMPKKVTLRDISLRSAEQTPGTALTAADRLRLLRALAEIGVSSFQVSLLGWRHPAEELRAEIKLVKDLNPAAEIEIGGVRLKESIDYVADLGANCISLQGPANFAISSFYVGEARQLAWEGKDWRRRVNPPQTLEELVERNKPLIDHAKKRGVKVKASMNMLLYVTEEDLERFSHAMAGAGADYISLHDGPGGMGPEAVAYAVTIAKRAAPQTRIAVHLHNTFNLGVAVNVAAVRAGAELLEVSVNGYCCASGQTDLAQIAAALEVFYGVDTGIRLEQLTSLRRLGEDITRIPVARNHPITGDSYFVWDGSDAITQELAVDPLIHWCVDPSVFGNTGGWVLGQISGPWTMLEKLTELGITVEKSEVEAILKEVKEELLIRKRVPTDDEIRSIASSVKGAARDKS